MNKYFELLNTYDVLTILIVMDHYEAEEDYKECQLILEALIRLSESSEVAIPTSISEVGVSEAISRMSKLENVPQNLIASRCKFFANKIVLDNKNEKRRLEGKFN